MQHQLNVNQVIHTAQSFVSDYIGRFDTSHDFTRIQRMVSLAKTIEARERILNRNVRFRTDVVTLTSLLHGVGDRNYLKPGEDGTRMVKTLLSVYVVDKKLLQKVHQIVNHVSLLERGQGSGKVPGIS
jgi:uncharacterized protein